jgi:hypothetical protein
MSHIKTLKITPTCFDHQLTIIRELCDPSYNHWLKFEFSCVVMRQHTFIHFACCIVWRGMSTCRHVKRPGLGVNRPPTLSSKVLTGWSIYSPSVPPRHGIQRNFTILGAFVASRSLLASPCLSACIIAARTGQIAVKFFTEQFYENLSKNPIRLTEAPNVVHFT